MDLIRLGRKGQVTIPKSVLKQARIADNAPLLVSAAADGSIVLRQAGVYPIELYTDERIAQLERENTIPVELERRVERLAAKRRGRRR